MKTSKLLGLVLFMSAFFFVGCSSSSSGEDPETPSTPKITGITLTADKSALDVGQSVVFTVKTNTGNNVTSSAKVLVNGTAIDGNTYTPATAGDYTAKATYQSFTSPEITFKAEETVVIDPDVSITSVTVTTDNNTIDAGNTATFSTTVTYSDGTTADKTSESTYLINDNEIVGNKFIGHSAGTSTVKTKFQDIISEAINLQIDEVSAPSSFTKKGVIEDYTGTWCGWCPRVAHAIDLVEDQTDKVFAIAAHLANDDPMENDFSVALSNAFDVKSFPTAYVNREAVWDFPEPSNIEQATNTATGNTNLGLAINSTLTGQTIQIVVSTAFAQAGNGNKLVVFVLEDGIMYDQSNYTSYYGGASTISNFEHNHVLRYAATDVLGDSVSNNAGVTHTSYTVNLAFSSSISNYENTGIIAMLVDSTGKKVLNAQYAKVNVDQDFD